MVSGWIYFGAAALRLSFLWEHSLRDLRAEATERLGASSASLKVRDQDEDGKVVDVSSKVIESQTLPQNFEVGATLNFPIARQHANLFIADVVHKS